MLGAPVEAVLGDTVGTSLGGLALLDGRRVTIVTDSTACLPEELVHRYAIDVVPLQVTINGHSGAEGSEVTPSMVVAALPDKGNTVSTKPPAQQAFADAYRRAAERGHAVVSIHLSAALSATCDVARAAAEEARAMGGQVRVVDSQATVMGLGFIALAGARTAAIGGSMDEVSAVAEAARLRTRALFYVDTLEYLRRSGRIGAASKIIGTALKLKPLLTLDNGIVAPLERQRGAERGMKRLQELVLETAGSDRVEVCVHHLGAPDKAAVLQKEIRDALGARLTDIHTTEISAVVGVHVGPGTLGAVVRRLQ